MVSAINQSATWNEKKGEWSYPQLYYRNGKPISKKKLLEQIAANALVQEAIRIEPRVGRLIDEAKQL